tara:strand:- start:2566 stop:2955 length:390 start_codon:yes stop_codon:yes gene_type:complete
MNESELYCKVESPLGQGMYKVQLPNGDIKIAKFKRKGSKEKVKKKEKQNSKIVKGDYVEVCEIDLKIVTTGTSYIITRKMNYEDIKLMARQTHSKNKKPKKSIICARSDSAENTPNGNTPVDQLFIDEI